MGCPEELSLGHVSADPFRSGDTRNKENHATGGPGQHDPTDTLVNEGSPFELCSETYCPEFDRRRTIGLRAIPCAWVTFELAGDKYPILALVVLLRELRPRGNDST